MKRIFVILSLAALVLTGCAKENFGKKVAGDEVSVSFVADMNQAATKATADNDGMGVNADQCRLQIYMNKGDQATLIYDKTKPVSAFKATFNDIVLIKDQNYDFLFWADNAAGAYYDTDNLKEVKLNGNYIGGNDARDAFFASFSETVTAPLSKNVELYRPFAQLNIITNDVQKVKAQVPAGVETVLPNKVVVKFNAPDTFNALTGEASGSKDFEYEAATYTDLVASTKELNTLSMDYIFASETKSINTIGFTAKNDLATSAIKDIDLSFTNIPLQRNWRTNITGSLLTNAAIFVVEIKPAWDGEHDVTFITEGSIAKANESLKAGKTNIEIIAPADAADPIVLPAETDGKDVALNISGVTGKTITVQLEAGAQGPANLYINSDSENLNVTAPNSHVVINSGDFAAVNAETSATTLVVGKDVKIANLNVTKGNVVIYGKVAAFNRPAGAKAEMYASDRATLINYINWAKNGDIAGLAADIDLAGENWTPLRIGDNRFNATFDGQGYSIKNMKIVSDRPYGAGFFSDMSGVAKNFTIDGADVSNETADKGNIYGIVAGYAYGAVTFENVKVKNSKLHAFGKVGAILGMAADPGTTKTVLKNCSVENTQIIGCYNVANFVGLLQNEIEMTGCTSSNVTKSIGGRYGEETYVTFVNEKVKNETTSKYVISNGKYWKNGTTYYSAFAEYYNDAKYDGNKAKDGTVDGIVVNSLEPIVVYDFDFECDGVKYSTLDLAVAAAATSVSKTVNILNAGTYKLPATIAANITIAGKEGVKMDCTGSASIASVPNGATFKDIEFTFGNNNYHGFYHAGKIVFNECTLNGYLVGYGPIEYNDCTVIQETEDVYSVQVYGNDFTCNNCEFFGTNKAILVYAESLDHVCNVTVNKCKFHASSTEDLKAAVQMNAINGACTGKYNTVIDDCTIDGFTKVYGFKHNPKRIAATVTVDGKVVYDGTYNLSLATAADLVEFAAAVNSGNTTFSGKTVYLENDVDMTGIEWKPIGNVNGYPSTTFAGTFDGQNHTVANLTADDNTSINATSGFFGSATGTIKNLKMTNVTITSLHWAGAICGYSSNSATVIENCHVKGGTVTTTPEWTGSEYDNGDKAGGIIGYCVTNDKILGCSVEDVIVRGYRDLGGICGFASAIVENCSVKNSTIVQDNTNGYKTSIDTYHEIIGRDNGAVTSGNTYSNVTVKSEN